MLTLEQFHIDMARNSTDDFNLFHDRFRWHWIRENPFEGPIALGFQLGLLIENEIRRSELSCKQGRYSSFEFSFANPVKLKETLSVQIRPAKAINTDKGNQESQRIVLRANGRPSIIGFHRQSDFATVENTHLNITPDYLRHIDDRSFLHDQSFLKRKWMILGNAKNFLLSINADQTEYIDEFANKITFPKFYPLALISSALLERGQAQGFDLIQNPMIYVSHHLCIDNQQIARLKSNDCLQMLVNDVSSSNESNHLVWQCTGWVDYSVPLFTSQLTLASLKCILES